MTGTRTAPAATIERRYRRVSVSAGDSGGRTSRDRARPRVVANNLPLTLDALVGRDEDLSRLRELLADHRLVTLTGAPGMGKTRLAVEVARASVAAFADGVWLVPLAPLGEPDLVGPAVASVLSAPAAAKRGGYDNLVARIADQRLLLVLDNCEHVLDACAQLAAALLEACPHLAIVATSQERLAVTGEQVWQLSGLAVPDPVGAEVTGEVTGNTAPGNDPTTAYGDAAASPAVQLFNHRARASSRQFVLTADNLGAVVDICRRLDGIPLAIELAAARVGMLSPAQIAGHLDDRFTFLTGGKRSSLPRHQTLKAAVDWSYDLLAEPEQKLLRRLSVFAGGASLEAVEQVCVGDGVNADASLDLMTTLVARSLVVADNSLPEARYRLLETIRFYGRDRLAEAGEVTSTAARHVRWCVSLAEQAEPHLTGPTQQEWMGRLDVDLDNLRTAMAWSLDQGPTEQALRIAGALTMFWRIRSHFAEGLDWLNRVTDVSEDAPPELRAKALWGKALMEAMLGHHDAALAAARASHDLWRALDNPQGRARSLLLLGSVTQNMARNVGVLQQAIALARHAGDTWCLAQALAQCGSVFSLMGDSGAARPVLEESIVVARSVGDEQCLSFALISLGYVALAQGDYSSAEAVLEEALHTGDSTGAYETAVARTGLAEVAVGRGDFDCARRLLAEAMEDSRDMASGQIMEVFQVRARLALTEGDLDAAEGHLAVCEGEVQAHGAQPGPSLLHCLGEVALARGDAVKAQAFLSEALELARAGGYKGWIAAALYSLGEVSRLDRDDAKAAALHRQALDLRTEIGNLPGIAASLEALAGLAARAGQVDKAARVFGSAHALRDINGYSRPSLTQPGYEADLAMVRDALGPEDFDAAWAEGLSLSAEAAAAYLSKGRGTRTKRPVSGVASLTDAERQVVQLVAQRLSNAEIGEQLFLSINTVKSHLRRVFEKLSVSSRWEIIKRYPDGKL